MEQIILLTSVLFFFASLSSKLAGRLGVPVLIIFLVLGILFGPDCLALIEFKDNYLAQFLGIISLIYILFMGGLSIEYKEIKPIFISGISLSTVGVLLTGFITGYSAYYFLDISLKESLLIGAIISSTDAAAVFGVLRSKNINLKENLKAILEFESASNDPMGVFLTISTISIISGKSLNIADFLSIFLSQMCLGIILGILFGKISVKIINSIKLEHNGLYTSLTLAIAALSYSLSTILGGNGFISVYITGLTMSSSKFIHKKMLIRFHDGIAWLMQILMFIILGLMVDINDLCRSFKPAMIYTLILIFLARPIAVFISLIPFNFSLNEKLFISWVGLKGVTPIILATFPLVANINKSNEIFSIVFFIVLISVMIQGTTLNFASQKLQVNETQKTMPKP